MPDFLYLFFPLMQGSKQAFTCKISVFLYFFTASMERIKGKKQKQGPPRNDKNGLQQLLLCKKSVFQFLEPGK